MACRTDARFRGHLRLPEVCPFGVTVETSAQQKPAYPAEVIRRPAGPGTELSKLLARFGINYTPTCPCRAMAQKMDAWGPDECAKPERIEEVLAAMRTEAGKRGLPFLDAAGRLLIKRAIQNARARANGLAPVQD